MSDIREGENRVAIQDAILAEIPANWSVRECVFSRNGRHVAFVATNDNVCLVRFSDGREMRFDFAEHPQVDHRGATTACRVRHEGKQFIVVNGEMHQPFSWVGDPVLSTTGSSIAYWAMNRPAGIPGNDEYWLVLGSECAGPFTSPGYLRPDGEGGFVWTARDSQGAFVNARGKRIGRFERVTYPSISPQDGAVWFWGLRGQDWLLHREHVPIEKSAAVFPGCGPSWSPARVHQAFWKFVQGQWYLVLDGNEIQSESQPAHHLGVPVLTDNGRYAYVAEGENGLFAVVSGDRTQTYEAMGLPVMSHDGRRWAVKVKRDGKEFILLDGQAGPPHDPLPPSGFDNPRILDDVPVFNDDASSIAYGIATQSKMSFIVDHTPGPLLDYLSGGPRFPPGKKTIVTMGIIGGKEFLWIGNHMSEPFDRIWSPGGRLAHTLRWQPMFAEVARKVVLGVRVGRHLGWRAFDV